MINETKKGKLKEWMTKYSAPLIALAGITPAMVIPRNRIQMERLHAIGVITAQEYNRYRRKNLSNNWLKMHGEPMKRRINK